MFTDGVARTIRIRAIHGGSVPEEGAGDAELFLPASGEGWIDPGLILARLSGLGLGRVLVEGGGKTVSGFLGAGVLDRLHLTVAPLLIGSGLPSIELPPIDRLSDALRPRARSFPLGSDILFDLDLR